jgi:hypothetical protein
VDKQVSEFGKPRVYVTHQGATLPLRPIPAMVIKQLTGAQTGKPKPPVVPVKVGDKTIKEVNENDPDYKAALEKWEEAYNERMFVYVLSQGVCMEPTKLDVQRLQDAAPELQGARLKFTWVMEMLENELEMSELISVIMGQTVPTEQGIRNAEETFPSDDQQTGLNEVPATESASVNRNESGL